MFCAGPQSTFYFLSHFCRLASPFFKSFFFFFFLVSPAHHILKRIKQVQFSPGEVSAYPIIPLTCCFPRHLLCVSARFQRSRAAQEFWRRSSNKLSRLLSDSLLFFLCHLDSGETKYRVLPSASFHVDFEERRASFFSDLFQFFYFQQ